MISYTSNIIVFIHHCFEMINQVFSSSGFFSKSLTYLTVSLSLNFLTLRFHLKGSSHYFPQHSGWFALYFFSLLFILFYVFQILTFCLLLRYSSLVSLVFFYLFVNDWWVGLYLEIIFPIWWRIFFSPVCMYGSFCI